MPPNQSRRVRRRSKSATGSTGLRWRERWIRTRMDSDPGQGDASSASMAVASPCDSASTGTTPETIRLFPLMGPPSPTSCSFRGRPSEPEASPGPESSVDAVTASVVWASAAGPGVGSGIGSGVGSGVGSGGRGLAQASGRVGRGLAQASGRGLAQASDRGLAMVSGRASTPPSSGPSRFDRMPGHEHPWSRRGTAEPPPRTPQAR